MRTITFKSWIRISVFLFAFHVNAEPPILTGDSQSIPFFEKTAGQGNWKLEAAPTPQNTPEESTPLEPFPWKAYLDPKNKEFFREGEYTPPEPFMEVVRNPTDQNIKLWFQYIDKKNELLTRFQERMQEYIKKNEIRLDPEVFSGESKVSPLLDTKRYRFRMYFDSKCQHCHRMFKTLLELQSKGFFVEAKQVDSAPLVSYPILISYVSQQELKQKDIQSVPVTFVGDLQKKVVYRMVGYQSAQEVLGSINGIEYKN